MVTSRSLGGVNKSAQRSLLGQLWGSSFLFFRGLCFLVLKIPSQTGTKFRDDMLQLEHCFLGSSSEVLIGFCRAFIDGDHGPYEIQQKESCCCRLHSYLRPKVMDS